MKTAIIALVLLIATLSLVIGNSIILGRAIDEICEQVAELDMTEASLTYEKLSDIYEEFKEKRSYIGLTVNHNDITSIEASFSELFGATLAEDMETAIMIKSRLVSELSHLRRLSGINFDSVF